MDFFPLVYFVKLRNKIRSLGFMLFPSYFLRFFLTFSSANSFQVIISSDLCRSFIILVI